MIIYAAHMLRAAVKAMQEVSREILLYGRTAEVEDLCVNLKEILHLSPIALAVPADMRMANSANHQPVREPGAFRSW